MTVSVKGTFDGFVNPITGPPQVNKGVVLGTIQYDVTSPNKPSQALLPRTEPTYTGLGTAMSQVSGGNETVTSGGRYLFSYSKVAATSIARPAEPCTDEAGRCRGRPASSVRRAGRCPAGRLDATRGLTGRPGSCCGQAGPGGTGRPAD